MNKIGFGNPGTVTQAQIDTLGRNFGLKDDNAANHLDLLNRKYNYQHKTADFEYLGIDTNLGSGWKIEDKVYTYSYNNESHEKPKVGSGAAAGQMLGSVKLNEYRTYGDTFQLVSTTTALGTFKAGLWYDRTTNHRYTYGVNYDTTGADEIDLTSAALYKAPAPGGNPATLPGGAGYNYKYLLVDKNKAFQLFAEYTWKVTTDFEPQRRPEQPEVHPRYERHGQPDLRPPGADCLAHRHQGPAFADRALHHHQGVGRLRRRSRRA